MTTEGGPNARDVFEAQCLEAGVVAGRIAHESSAIVAEKTLGTIQVGKPETVGELIEEAAAVADNSPDALVSVVAVANPADGTKWQLVSCDMDGRVYVNLGLLGKMRFNELYIPMLSDTDTSSPDSISDVFLLLVKGFEYYLDDEWTADFSRISFNVALGYVMDAVRRTQPSWNPVDAHIVFLSEGIPFSRSVGEFYGRMSETGPSRLSSVVDGVRLFFGKQPSRFPYSVRVAPIPRSDERAALRTSELGLSTFQADAVNASSSRFSAVLGLAGSGKTRTALRMMVLESAPLVSLRKTGKMPFSSLLYTIHDVEVLKRVAGSHGEIMDRFLKIGVDDIPSRLADKAKHIRAGYASDEALEGKKVYEELFAKNEGALADSFVRFVRGERNVGDSFGMIVPRATVSKMEAAVASTERFVEDHGGILDIALDILVPSRGRARRMAMSRLKSEIAEAFGPAAVDVLVESGPAGALEYCSGRIAKIAEDNRIGSDIVDEGNVFGYECVEYDMRGISDHEIMSLFAYLSEYASFFDEAARRNVADTLERLSSLGKIPFDAIIEKDYVNLLSAFPFVAAPMSEIASFPGHYGFPFVKTYVDEAFLYLGMALYPISEISLGVNVFGDANQFDAGILFSSKEITKRSFSIFSEIEPGDPMGAVTRFSTAVSSKSGARSLFDIFSSGVEPSLLLDNFRSREDIARAQVSINRAYISYMSEYARKRGIPFAGEGDLRSLVKIHRRDVSVTEVPGLGKVSGSMMYLADRTVGARLRRFFGIVEANGGDGLVISLFRGETERLSEEFEVYRAETGSDVRISFMPLESVQSVEADSVYFETFMDAGKDSEGYSFIKSYPSSINIALTRARERFVMAVPANLETDDFISNIIYKRFKKIK